MSQEQLEARLAVVERELAELKRRLPPLEPIEEVKADKWWERIKPIPEHLLPEFEAAMAYSRYYRMTGKEPPPDWKPGDPIPEPEFDE